jgi:hypothetical protein
VERDRWQRWSPLAGVAFAILLLAALGVSLSGPGDTPAEVADWYADDSNRGAAFFVFFLLVGAALVFLWFLAALRGVLVRAEGDPARWTALAFGAGVASATLLLASASLYVTPAVTAGQDAFPFDPGTANALENAGYALLLCSTMSGAWSLWARRSSPTGRGCCHAGSPWPGSWSQRPCSLPSSTSRSSSGSPGCSP